MCEEFNFSKVVSNRTRDEVDKYYNEKVKYAFLTIYQPKKDLGL